jgi:hypothetical protein
MLTAKPSRQSSAVWQGLTKDGYTLRLNRSRLTPIISQLKQTGLEHLVKSNNKGNLEAAVVVSIAQIVKHAAASRTVSSQEFGQNLRAFTAIGKTRKYQVLTQPIDSKQSAILFLRSTPIQKVENEYEGEYENEYENEYEGEYESGRGRSSSARAGRSRSSSLTGRGRSPSPAPSAQSIGSRVRDKSKLATTKSPRLRNKLQASGTGTPRYRHRPYAEPKVRGFWNRDTGGRPGFLPSTKTEVLLTMPRGQQNSSKYQCQGSNCTKELTKKEVTLDHIKPWKGEILQHARADSQGMIPTKEAKRVYSNTKNLKGMCRSCNSKKGGPRGIYQ